MNTNNENLKNDQADNQPVIYLNSQNCPEVARLIEKFSPILMERNYLAYKELASK